MNLLFYLAGLLIFPVCMPSSAYAAESALHTSSSSDKPLQVLFIGNSYTYYNNLPGMVAAMSGQVPGHVAIAATMVAQGSASLRRLWDAGGAMQKIWKQDWDYVVLQESSSIPSNKPGNFTEYIRKFDPLIRGKGAQTLLFMTWAHEGRPSMYQDNLEVFNKVAAALDIPYAPVGTAWHLALALDPDIRLYDADGTHPNRAGTYLAACVFLHVLLEMTQQCPLATTYQLTDAENEVIQQAAAQAVSQYNAMPFHH